MSTFPHCRGCDAEILWARVDGRWKPFEAEPCREGTHVMRFDEVTTDRIALFAEPPNKRPLSGARYQLHNATCPASGKFGKRGDA